MLNMGWKQSCHLGFHVHGMSRKKQLPHRPFTEGPKKSDGDADAGRINIKAKCTSHQSLTATVPSPSPSPSRVKMGGLAGDGMSYKEKFVIRCYEVGANRTATIEAVANLMQEAACNHAQSIGFSTEGFSTTPSMRRQHLIWVAARMHIEVSEYPLWGDVVEIETWCQGMGKIGTRRDWILKDAASGILIGRATSTWVMMNQDTRRLARVTDDIKDEYLIYCPDDPRLAFPEENSSSSKKISKLDDPAQYIISGLMPRRSDLDMNQHVNNVTYIGWLLESVPQEILETHELQAITLDYRRECNKGDIVESLTTLESELLEKTEVNNGVASSTNGVLPSKVLETQPGKEETVEFLHLIRLADSRFEINRGRSEWRKKLLR